MKKRRAARSHIIAVLIIQALVLSGCNLPSLDLPSAPAVPTQTPVSNPLERLQFYFTDPTAAHAKDYQGGPDEVVASEIDRARLSVDVAAYSLNLWSLRDALIQAHQRGVVVRMVMESDNMDSREVQQIQEAGIPIVGDQHEGLMHNKYIVIDHSVVWTGSMNFTVGGAYKDNNNLVRIQSGKAAEDYSTEFEEMFSHHLFGPDAIVNTPYPKIDFGGYPVEIYFSPDDKVEARIVELVQNAQESINFMAYNFTSNNIGDAIIQQAQAGLSVAGVIDDTQVLSSQGTEYDAFNQDGLDVHLDGNQTGLMHHKVIIIDNHIVVTGSYNFTASASETNDENVVIIFNTDVAQKYMEEFQRVYAQSKAPESSLPSLMPDRLAAIFRAGE
jgi:phosphatidylserine/phosphatidylglycerophosphate/cardiolipin synthase-like enzyme